jgi:hypothetical protein
MSGVGLSESESASIAAMRRRAGDRMAEFLAIAYHAIRAARARRETSVTDPFAGSCEPGPNAWQAGILAGALRADGLRVTELETMPPKLVIHWGDPGDSDGDGA